MSAPDNWESMFTPYQVVDSGRSVEKVFDQVNEAVWYGYGPDYRAGGSKKIVAGPEFDFVALLRDLTKVNGVRFVSHWELLGTPCGDDEIRVAFRHDIDSDIVAAQQQAEIEADFGVTANWVVLHTAPYYGAVNPESSEFERHDSMIEVYKRIQDLGHEVSLHSDPLGLYQFHGIDGAAGFTTELAWLRSHGLEIRGSTGHNFRPTYGAENFEVFKSFVAPAPNAQPADATWVNHNGKGAPLRVLDDVALGLEYEGNQVFWREDMNLEYGSARFTNLWFWTDHRRLRNADPQILDREFLDQRRMVAEIANMPGGTDVVLVVHPEYFGARSGHDQPPSRSFDQVTTVASESLGWQVYEPWTVVAESQSARGEQTAQSFNVANELGMLDTPIEGRPEAERRVVVAGGQNFDGRRVAIPSQFTNRVGLLGEDRLSQTVDFRKVAHPGLAVDRLWGWIKTSVLDVEPDTVVVGVSASLDGFGLAAWKPVLPESVIGSYLAVSDGVVSEHSYPGDEVDTEADWSAVLACYRWIIEWLWQREIRTVLMVESPVGDAETWRTHPHRRTLQSLATSTGALLVDPTENIERESRRLNDLSNDDLSNDDLSNDDLSNNDLSNNDLSGAHAGWNSTAHRVASEELFSALFPQATPPEFKSNFERRREALDAANRLLPPASALGLPAEAAMAEHRERTEALRIKEYPTPFVSAVSIVGDIDGSSTHFYNQYMGRLVGELGLDHGDSIHLVGYHQRYSRGRRGLATNIRAILSYDLRRDNAASGQGQCWISHVLREFHRGNIDHLHGLYAWGARSLPLGVSSIEQGQTALESPFMGADVVPAEAREPFAYNAEHFPLISVAVEIVGPTGSAPTVPSHVVPRYAPQPVDQDSDTPNLQQRRPDAMVLTASRRLPSGNTLATYTAPSSLLTPVDPFGANGVVPQTDLLGIDIDLDSQLIVGAALHNTDVQGIRTVMAELRQRFGVAFDLITAHGRYHFYTSEAIGPQMAGLERVRDERGREKPHALFGLPSEGGAASTAIADDANSAAQVFPALYGEGIRYLVPCGLISRKEAIFDLRDATFPAVDRNGVGVQFMRRTQPDCAWEPANPDHNKYSRLSTFENRLRHVLDLLDAGQVGVWPIYTHLGQTNDMDAAPDTWFGDGVIEDLADRYYGVARSSAARPWVTRASILANYSSVMQVLPDLVARKRDHIDIAQRVDRTTNRSVPEHVNQLFGVSFEVDDTRKATVSFDGAPVRDVVRWHDRSEITLVPCGIRWPIIDRNDPVEVARYEGDLKSVTVTRGHWSWHTDAHHDRTGLESFGRLTVGESGTALLRIDLDSLDLAGVQVAAMRLRQGHGLTSGRIRLITEGGPTYEIHVGDPDTSSDCGTFRTVTRTGEWADVHAPLWGFDWRSAVGIETLRAHRTITAIEIHTTGASGSTLDIAELVAGRARTTPPTGPDGSAIIGGDAVGHDRVRLENLATGETFICAVEPDGLWASPPICRGAWSVSIDGTFERLVQVITNRFDLSSSDRAT